jgi:hypothetical protein
VCWRAELLGVNIINLHFLPDYAFEVLTGTAVSFSFWRAVT